IAHDVRNVERRKALHIAFVKTQEPSAGREVVIDHVEYFSVYALGDASQGNRVGTVVDIGQRDTVRTAKMQQHSKCVDAYPTSDCLFVGTIYGAWSHDNVGDSVLLSVFGDDFILLDLREAIGVATAFGMLLDWCTLIE